MLGVTEGGFIQARSSPVTKPNPTTYVSTAIPFVSARPHLGFALELCIADAYARHARARGRDVYFVSGSDDHSLKNVRAAERAGVSTAQFVAEHAALFQQLMAALEISLDAFVRTSAHPGHRPAVYALWQACAARGDLYRQTYRGLYCVGCERFVEPNEASCPEHSAALEEVSEDNWFFRLSRYTELLRVGLETGRLNIAHPGAREEASAFLREPLRDLCVSRSAARARNWGLPVPGDPDQVIWVWFDALAYYLTALDFGSDPAARYQQFWCGEGQRVHVIGKGIGRFHALYWPAILASAGVAWPSDLLVHGYLTLEGEKISKSGRVIDPLPLVSEFGADPLRYYLLRHVRTARDGDFSREKLERAYAELANGLGNLVNRVLGLIARSHGGCVLPRGRETAASVELREAALALPGKIDEAIARFAVDEALDAVFALVELDNRVIDRVAPWALIRRGELQEANGFLRCLLETLRVIAREVGVFLPGVGRRLGELLRIGGGTVGEFYGLADGLPLPAALQLFPRRGEL
jgi:methionyl-tRNA synthetase